MAQRASSNLRDELTQVWRWCFETGVHDSRQGTGAAPADGPDGYCASRARTWRPWARPWSALPALHPGRRGESALEVAPGA